MRCLPACLLIFTFLALGFTIQLNAQTAVTRQCNAGSDKKVLDIQHRNALEINDFLLNQSLTTRNSGYIPLVFHFVLKEGQDTFSTSQVLAQIEVLNECFNGQNSDLAKLFPQFRNSLSTSGPRFCLAEKLEEGKIKPGIQQKYTDINDIGSALNPEGKRHIKSGILGGFDGWDPELYINIWVGDLSIAQGQTTFPNSVPKDELGIVIDPDYFGIYPAESASYPFHLGKTLVHEMAHYFNLLHIWGIEQSCSHDDGIEDTPDQQFIYTGCPSVSQFSCNSEDMFMNFMNFTDDACLIHFTEDQMAHMEAAIELFYPALYSFESCFYPIVESDNILEQIEIFYVNDSRSLTLRLPNPTAVNVSIEIFHLDGKGILKRSLYNESSEEISLNHLPSGIYILFLQAESNFISRKLVVY